MGGRRWGRAHSLSSQDSCCPGLKRGLLLALRTLSLYLLGQGTSLPSPAKHLLIKVFSHYPVGGLPVPCGQAVPGLRRGAGIHSQVLSRREHGRSPVSWDQFPPTGEPATQPLAGGPVCFSLPRAHLPFLTPGGYGLGDGRWCKCKYGGRDGLVEGQSPFLPLCGDSPSAGRCPCTQRIAVRAVCGYAA